MSKKKKSKNNNFDKVLSLDSSVEYNDDLQDDISDNTLNKILNQTKKKKKKNVKYDDFSNDKEMSFEERSKKLRKEWIKIRNREICHNKDGYDQRIINEYIENFSRYRELIGSGDDGMLVINNLQGDEFLDCIEDLQNLIKNLKKGKCEDSIVRQRYHEIITNGDNYDRE